MTEQATPPINADWLARMRSRPDFLRALFANFLCEEPKRQAALAAAVGAGDAAQVRYLAHSLKGAAATLGMEPLCAACRELEFAARDEERQRQEKALAAVTEELARVYAVIDDPGTLDPLPGGRAQD